MALEAEAETRVTGSQSAVPPQDDRAVNLPQRSSAESIILTKNGRNQP